MTAEQKDEAAVALKDAAAARLAAARKLDAAMAEAENAAEALREAGKALYAALSDAGMWRVAPSLPTLFVMPLSRHAPDRRAYTEILMDARGTAEQIDLGAGVERFI